MQVGEIFSKIANHMLDGMMTHEELANYYDFLNLKGYKRCHEYHFMDELLNYRMLSRYYINHYNQLIPDLIAKQPEVIPNDWYSHNRQDVDPSTIRAYTEKAFTMWVEWEKQTKSLYEECYSQLLSIDEIAAADIVLKLIKDVDKELKKAERHMLHLNAINYDIVAIMDIQEEKHKYYKDKMKKGFKIDIC